MIPLVRLRGCIIHWMNILFLIHWPSVLLKWSLITLWSLLCASMDLSFTGWRACSSPTDNPCCPSEAYFVRRCKERKKERKRCPGVYQCWAGTVWWATICWFWFQSVSIELELTLIFRTGIRFIYFQELDTELGTQVWFSKLEPLSFKKNKELNSWFHLCVEPEP